MATDHNIRQLIINKVPTKAQYDQMVKNADELYLTPDDSNGLPDQTGQSGKFLTTNGSTASWANVPAGTVTSVRVQAGTGLSSSQSTAQNSTLNTTISIASGYKLPTTTEWNNKQDALPSQSGQSGKFLTTNGTTVSWATVQAGSDIDNSTITENSNNEIQTVGIKDDRNGGTIKVWTGTKAQYDTFASPAWSTLAPALYERGGWGALAYGNGIFVSIGTYGYVSTSYDGTTWTDTEDSNLASHSYWYAITYDGSNFIALSSDGYISTSSDGTSWSAPTQVSNLGNNTWYNIVYDGSKLLALGYDGYISTSTDGGTTWTVATQISTLNGKHWRGIVYTGTKFVSLSYEGYVSTSTNGTTWTTPVSATSALGSNNAWFNLAYNGSKFVAIGMYGYVSESIDGINWETATRPSSFYSNAFHTLAYGNSLFVTISSNSGYVSTRLDGANSDTLYNIKDYGLYLGSTEVANVSSGGDSLPDQTGQSGKFLTTNGSTVSWGNAGTVTSVRVQAGTGLTSSTSTAQNTTLNTTISIASGYKLPTTTEWSNKQDALPTQSGNSGKFLTTNGSTLSWGSLTTNNVTTALGYTPYNSTNPNGYTSNTGTVRSVQVQAGTGLTSSTSTAQNTTLSTTISVASGYKLPTTTEWSGKQDALPTQSGNSGKFLTTNGSTMSWVEIQGGSDIDNSTITKNTNDELQTVGIKDVRTDNTIKTWTGTKTQYNNLVSNIWSTPVQGPNFNNNYWQTLAYGNGKFVTLSYNSLISTSTDGTTWTTASPSGISESMWSGALVYGNGKFVALNADGYISTSTDGTTWTTATYVSNLGSDHSWVAIAYGGNKYIALSQDSYFSTSIDGITWEEALTTYNDDHAWVSLVYDGSRFIALSSDGYLQISSDGTGEWLLYTYDELLDLYWTDLIYDGTKLKALSEDGSIATSINGSDWTVTLQGLNGTYPWYSLAYGNNKYVAISNSGYISTKDNDIESNTLYNVINDGLYLGENQVSTITTQDNSTITENSSNQIQVVGIKDARTNNTIGTWTGTNAQYDALINADWSTAIQINNIIGYYWNGLAYGNGKFIILSAEGYISTSTDGSTWTIATQVSNLEFYSWISIAYGNNKFVALDQYGCIATSIDGTIWDRARSISNLSNVYDWISITYGNGKFIILSAEGYISTSTDGSTWTTPVQDSNLGNNDWRSLTYGNGKYVALGYGGHISTSTDGTTWTSAVQDSNLGSNYWLSITYGNGKFIALSQICYVSESFDGTTWTTATQVSNLGSNYWNLLAYGNNKFVALSGYDYYVSTKNEGININILYNVINDGLYLGTTPIANIGEDPLPSQSGQSGKYLTTNGTTVSWATVQAGPKFLTFQNITASTWVSDNTYSEYSYKCVLTCTGVTSSDYAQVIFNPAQSVSGNYANVCLTDTDTVTIYSKVNTAISIPTITVIGSN